MTNICKNLCGFCGFGRKATDAGAYCHDREGIQTQLALLSGANDLAGTMFTDDVSGDAGASGSDYLDPADMDRIVQDIGRRLKQRTTLYEII